MYAFNRNTRMHLTESHVCASHNLTESHAYAFNRITHVTEFIKGSHTYILHNRTCMRSTESHMYAFNRITRVCI